MIKIIANIKLYLTTDANLASEFIDKLHICQNCDFFKQKNLFDGYCKSLERCVDADNCCEGFQAKDKKVEYWLQKMGQIYMDYSGISDECRRIFK